MMDMDTEQRILSVLDDLLEHDISKSDAINKLSALLVVPIQPNTKEALKASVSALYFADSSDYKNYHKDVVRELTSVDTITDEFIRELFNTLCQEK